MASTTLSLYCLNENQQQGGGVKRGAATPPPAELSYDLIYSQCLKFI